MLKRTLLLLGVVGFVFALWVLLPQKHIVAKSAGQHSEEIPEHQLTGAPESQKVPAPEAPKEAEAALPAPVPAAQPSESLAHKMPKLQNMRKEVAKDPHNTPESMLTFAVEMEKKMQSATTSEKAGVVFSELRDCVSANPETAVPSVQGLCLLNAKRLAAKYPALGADYHNLEQSADPQAIKVMNQVER